MLLIFAKSWFSGTLCCLTWRGGPAHCHLRNKPGSKSHGGRSPSYLGAGAGNRGVCIAENGQTVGREPTQTGRFSVHAFGDEAGLREGTCQPAAQKPGPQQRSPCQSSA